MVSAPFYHHSGHAWPLTRDDQERLVKIYDAQSTPFLSTQLASSSTTASVPAIGVDSRRVQQAMYGGRRNNTTNGMADLYVHGLLLPRGEGKATRVYGDTVQQTQDQLDRDSRMSALTP